MDFFNPFLSFYDVVFLQTTKMTTLCVRVLSFQCTYKSDKWHWKAGFQKYSLIEVFKPFRIKTLTDM